MVKAVRFGYRGLGNMKDLKGLRRLLGQWRGFEQAFRYGFNKKGETTLPHRDFQLDIAKLGQSMDEALEFVWAIHQEFDRAEYEAICREEMSDSEEQ